MQFSQAFIDEQILQIRALQNDIHFLERRQAEADKKIKVAQDAQAEKDRKKLARKQSAIAAKKKRDAAKEEGVVLAPATAAQQAKAVFKARAQKKINDEARRASEIQEPRVGGPNLEGKIRVRLSHNLEVWASPDADIGQLKQKFLHRNQKVDAIGGKKAEPAAQELTPGMIYNLVRLGEI